MQKVTLTPAEVSEIIDQAFALGKVYATDELAFAPNFNTKDLIVYRDDKTWTSFLEAIGGTGLNAGDAKLDILWQVMALRLKEDLKQYVDY